MRLTESDYKNLNNFFDAMLDQINDTRIRFASFIYETDGGEPAVVSFEWPREEEPGTTDE